MDAITLHSPVYPYHIQLSPSINMVLITLLANLFCSLFGIFCSNNPNPTPRPTLRPTIAPSAAPAASPGGALTSLMLRSQATLFDDPCDSNLAELIRTGDLTMPVTLQLPSAYPELSISPSPVVFATGQSSVIVSISSSNAATGFCGLTERSYYLRFEGPNSAVTSNTVEFKVPDFTSNTCNVCSNIL